MAKTAEVREEPKSDRKAKQMASTSSLVGPGNQVLLIVLTVLLSVQSTTP